MNRYTDEYNRFDLVLTAFACGRADAGGRGGERGGDTSEVNLCIVQRHVLSTRSANIEPPKFSSSKYSTEDMLPIKIYSYSYKYFANTGVLGQQSSCNYL